MAVTTYALTWDAGNLAIAGVTDHDLLPAADDPHGPGVTLGGLVIVSLLTDRRAEPGDVLPDASGDPVYRGGWWGDTYAGEADGASSPEGDRFGSRIWLLRRSRVTQETVQRLRLYTEEALAWLVEDGIAGSVVVEAERRDRARGTPYIALGVTLTRGDATRYRDLWTQEGIGG